MKELLGDNYAHFEEAMKPSVATAWRGEAARGERPQARQPLQAAACSRRDLDQTDSNPFASTLRSPAATFPKTRCRRICTRPGAPSPKRYLFEDREKMPDLASWFEKYGRPKEGSINMGPYSTSHLAASCLRLVPSSASMPLWAPSFPAHARLNLPRVPHVPYLTFAYAGSVPTRLCRAQTSIPFTSR